MPWYVLYTKPRNEKKLALLLEKKGITVYCPLNETIKQWSDRKKKVQEPLFKSYIFVYLSDYENENTTTLMTAGAVRFLWWNGKPGVVRDTEIQSIKDFLNKYRGVEITADIQEGETVTIKEGPLKETEATVIKVQGNKAILHLKSLGWNLTALMPLQSLEKK